MYASTTGKTLEPPLFEFNRQQKLTMKNDHLNSTVLDDETTRRLHELCTRLYDEVISNEESEELNRLLDSKPAARQFYLQYVSLHNMLLGSVGKHQRMEAELLGQRIDTGDIANTLEPKGANASFGIESKPAPGASVIHLSHFIFLPFEPVSHSDSS